MQVGVIINGEPHSHDVEPRTLLVHYIRDNCDLTGTNIGCDTSSCGACTVHIDGAAEKSCQTKASAAVGRTITTIEGLSVDSSHPIQVAWTEHDVPQCGYCQSGQIMAAAALLAKRPNPSDADIDADMADNLCRCGTYVRIRSAIHRAAEIAAQ